MNATVVIPTYWAGDDARANAPGTYDHSTRLNAANPELDRCLASLEQVRRQGYAVEDGEYKIGLRSVSAPVYGVDGAVRCTVGIVGMLRSTHSEEFRRAVEQVTAAGRMLSAALGYTGE